MNDKNALINIILDSDYTWNENGKVWYVGKRLPYLFCADIENKEIKVVCQIPNMSEKGYRQYTQLIKYQHKLICLPSFAKHILIYNLEKQAFNKAVVENCENVSQIWCVNAGISGDKMYIVVTELRRIIVFDLVKEEISASFEISCIGTEDQIGTQSTLYDGKIYIPIATREMIVSFDIGRQEFRQHMIYGDIHGCGSICHDDSGCCWIIGQHYGIVRWHPITQQMLEIKDIPNEFTFFTMNKEERMAECHLYSEKRTEYVEDSDECYFCWESFCKGRYLWVVPLLSTDILQINMDTLQPTILRLQEVHSGEKIQYMRDIYDFISWGIDTHEKLRIISRQNYEMYSIDTDNLSYQTDEWNVLEDSMELIIKNLIGNTTPLRENRIFDLEVFFSAILERYMKMDLSDINYVKIGDNIWHMLLNSD